MPFPSAPMQRGQVWPQAFYQVGFVIQAWETAKRKYAAEAIVQRTSREFYALMASFVPGLLTQFRSCLIAICTGATVGGAVGAILSGGPGAIPGAAVGAKVGLLVASWYLTALGLRFLLEYVYDGLGDVGRQLLEGIDTAWHSEGRNEHLDLAARRLADAIGILFAMILQALVSFVLKKGRVTARRRFAQSAFGRRVYGWVVARAQLHQVVCNVLLKPRAPAGVRRRVVTALQFFERQRDGLRDRYGHRLSDALRDHYLRAIDFSGPVEVVTLPAGTRLIGYMDPHYPFGKFVTRSGVYHNRLGLDPAGRQLVVYVMTKDVRVLWTRTAGIAIPSAKDRLRAWKQSRAAAVGSRPPVILQAEGGGVQYVVPDSQKCLVVAYQHFPGKPERGRVPNKRHPYSKQ